MEQKLRDRIKEKSTNQLLDIILNKDEYKQELVDAAEEELRLRRTVGNEDAAQKVNHSNLVDRNDKPPGVYAAVVLLIASVPIWLIIAFVQAGVSVGLDNDGLALTSIWNTFFALASIVIAIGVFQLRDWGYHWGLGTGILNAVILALAYFLSEESSLFILFLSLMEAGIAISLKLSSASFPLSIGSMENQSSISSTADENSFAVDAELKERMQLLHNLLEDERKKLVGFGVNNEILNLIGEHCKTKQGALDFIHTYNSIFKADLCKLLESLSSSYQAKRQYLHVFIEFGIVSPNYPHDRLD